MKYPTLAYILLSVLVLMLSGCAQLGIYRLHLRALPQEGPAPLTVSFVAEITGGLDTSPELHCQTQQWDFGDGQLMGVFGLCKGWRPGTKIDRHFRQRYTYEEPGVYTASVSYGPLKSGPVMVRVVE